MSKLFATPWTVARQAPLSIGFSRQEYWSGLPFPYPGDLPKPEIKPRSLALEADSLPSETPGNKEGNILNPGGEHFKKIDISYHSYIEIHQERNKDSHWNHSHSALNWKLKAV